MKMKKGWLSRELKKAREDYNSWPKWKKKAAEIDIENAKDKTNEGRMTHRMRKCSVENRNESQ